MWVNCFPAVTRELAALVHKKPLQSFHFGFAASANPMCPGLRAQIAHPVRMISESLADAGTVDNGGDPDATEVIRRPDGRQLQKMRRAESACAQDDLLLGEGLMRAAATPVFDADGTTAADDHPA